MSKSFPAPFESNRPSMGTWHYQPTTRRSSTDAEGKPVLTLDELSVLRRVAAGQSIKDAAAAIGARANTTSTKLYHLRRRFGVRTNAELIALLDEHGLLRETT